MLCTSGSLDKTVRLWDIQLGMPLSISKPHGGTVRAVAIDPNALVSGSTDNVLRLWQPSTSTPEDPLEDADPSDVLLAGIDSDDRFDSQLSHCNLPLFDLAQPERQLRGHIGPISALCLTDTCLYSGSWDYTVRVWHRKRWSCVSVLKYEDWVWSVVARGPHLLVSTGSEVHVHDASTAQLVRKVRYCACIPSQCIMSLCSTLACSASPQGVIIVYKNQLCVPSVCAVLTTCC